MLEGSFNVFNKVFLVSKGVQWRQKGVIYIFSIYGDPDIIKARVNQLWFCEVNTQQWRLVSFHYFWRPMGVERDHNFKKILGMQNCRKPMRPLPKPQQSLSGKLSFTDRWLLEAISPSCGPHHPEASIETKNKEIMTKEEQKGSTEASIVEAWNLPMFFFGGTEQCGVGLIWKCWR